MIKQYKVRIFELLVLIFKIDENESREGSIKVDIWCRNLNIRPFLFPFFYPTKCHSYCNNEIFINGETNIGNQRKVQRFDRNRMYLALGYSFTDNFRTQAGWMEQTTTNWSKGQLQFSMHHTF